MRNYLKIFCILFVLVSCNSDRKVIRLLTSDESRDIIRGAYEAGKIGDKKFVPYLLANADDMRSTTHIKFKGFTVYQAKMGALKNIYKIEPPVMITDKPDSIIIKFYTDLYEKSR